MQNNKKQEILKLLNLDDMINDYLKEPKFNRRVPAKNYIPKAKNIQSCLNIKKNTTLDINLASNRNHSTRSFGNKTIAGPQYSRNYSAKNCKIGHSDFNQSTKACSQRVLKRAEIQSAKGQRIFKSETIFGLNSSCQLQEVIQKCPDKIEVNKSTNIYDSISQINKFQAKTGNVGRLSKKKVKINLPNCFDSGEVLKGRYKMQKVIGRGLSGLVYKAKDILSERFIAIKIIDPSNVQYQFIKQIKHPNIISYYNSFLQHNKRYIVLEYLPFNLGQLIRKRRLIAEQVKSIFKGICSGLMYLHSLSYAHRDIKLDNIVTNQDLSIVKFIDFGLCLDVSESEKKQKLRFCGTTSYIAPQVINGKCREPKKADIWSLGIVLYTLSVGRNPFIGRQQMEVYHKIRNNKIVFPKEMGQSLKNLLEDMLKKDPQQRPSILQVINHSWLTQ